MNYRLTDWLPTTKKEMKLRRWSDVDIVFFSGDAYVDHPAFGIAILSRLLEDQGFKVAVVPQPDWRSDNRDFTKMGKPRLFFAISAGSMDSMVNHYTANKRLRHNDAYTADNRFGFRPDYPTIVYSKILKELYPDTPIIIGGIEASLRRLVHYDYWQDKLKPSILLESKADLLIYGMGEKPFLELSKRIKNGEKIQDIKDMPQTSYIRDIKPKEQDSIYLYSYEDCLENKILHAKNFKVIEEESNKMISQRIIQVCNGKETVVNPPFEKLTTEELDYVYDLPYTRLPHPKYKGHPIPAFDMIKFSVNLHRGCFGGCSFCTISAHQGKHITSRSKGSILREVKKIAQMDDFKGYLSDLGGPSANMYEMNGKDEKLCLKCKRPTCLLPKICPNLNTDHKPLIDIYRSVDALPEIKKSFLGSGIRYDLAMADKSNEYLKEVIFNHVSGRMKVAPEHTNDHVLELIRKPNFEQFKKFTKIYNKIEDDRQMKRKGGRQQLIPYFVSSLPDCTDEAMAELAVETKNMNFRLEQIQDFTPTPMTYATVMYYTGVDPYTMQNVIVPKTKEEKLNQRQFFFWYDKSYRKSIINELRKIKREDLIQKLF